MNVAYKNMRKGTRRSTTSSIQIITSLGLVTIIASIFSSQTDAQAGSSSSEAVFTDNYVVSKISNSTDFAPMDWSRNGKFVVGGNSTHILSLDVQTRTLTELLVSNKTYPLSSSGGKEVKFESISIVKLSYFDKQLLFRATGYIDDIQVDELFIHDIPNLHLRKITNNHEHLDTSIILSATWMPDGNIALIENEYFYSEDSNGEMVVEGIPSLWIADTDGNKQRELLSGKDWGGSGIPDVTDDGKKIAFFHEQVFGHIFNRADSLRVYDIESGELEYVNHNIADCANHLPQWSPNNELILFQTHGCDRGAPFQNIEVVSIDGTFHEKVIQYDALSLSSSPVVSPDGNHLMFAKSGGYGDTENSGVYLLELAHPMPEFGSLAMFVIVISMIGATLTASRFMRR